MSGAGALKAKAFLFLYPVVLMSMPYWLCSCGIKEKYTYLRLASSELSRQS